MEEEKELTLKEEVKELSETLKGKKKKVKKFRIPYRAKLNLRKLRKGYVIVVFIEDNGNIDFIREPIDNGTIKINGRIHPVKESDVFLYKNKPIIFQTDRKNNPYNPLKGEHETYGQDYIIARMMKDTIVPKKKLGGLGMSIGGLIIAGIIVYALFTGA